MTSPCLLVATAYAVPAPLNRLKPYSVSVRRLRRTGSSLEDDSDYSSRLGRPRHPQDMHINTRP